MHHNYEARYKQAVEAMVDGGVEVYLLSGKAYRAKTAKALQRQKEQFMTPEFEQDLRCLCRGSLELTTHSADLIVKRDRGGDSVSGTWIRGVNKV